MNLRVLLFVKGLLLFAVVAFCQKKEGLEIPNYTAHSPNVTSLGQYGEYPVEKSTGVPAISIPLYTVKGTKLEVPITVSYHAGGIKVDQDASFIGLGWVLNAGGNVTRIIKDKPDDQAYGFKTIGQSLPDYNSIEDIQAAGFIGNSAELQVLFSQDKEPDLFVLSANGLSDEFCLDNTGAFISTGQEVHNYNVDLTNKVITVRDKLGNIYRFGKALDGTHAFETTQINYSTLDPSSGGSSFPGHPSYPSSYHLTEIISADLSDTIIFKYKIGYFSDKKVVGATRYLINSSATSPTVDGLGRSFDGRSMTSMTSTITNVQIPDKIIFKNGSLEFSTADDRQDMVGGTSEPSRTRITGFTVYDAKRNVIQRISLQNASYFSRTGVGREMDNLPVGDHRRKSLKLDAAQFFDRNNVFVNEYRFEYDSTPLPPRNTSSQDLWGYYNGKNNESLIPTSFFQSSRTGEPVFIGESRATDFNFMKAAVLKKIIFPTGGYSVYNFEPNYYLKREQREGNRVERTKTVSCYAINRLSTCDPEFLQGIPANNTIEFQITEDISEGSADLYVMFTDYKVTPNALSMTYKITNLSNGQSFTYEHPPGEKSQRKVVEQAISIHKGDIFRLEAKTNGVTGSDLSICNSPYIESRFSYSYWEAGAPIEEITPQQAGGLRVKTISSFDINNNLITKKAYEYGDTRYVVGVGNLITDPGKNFYNYPLLYAENATQDLKNLIWFTSDSQVELGLNRGCPVDYDRVVEKIISNDDNTPNGKTEYIFSGTTGENEPKSGTKYPYNPIVYPSWRKSNLIKEVRYMLDNGNYVPVKSVEYEYNELPVKKVKILKMTEYEPNDYHAFMQPSGSWTYFTNNAERFSYYNYYVSCGKTLIHKEVSKDYVNGTDSLVVEKVIEYNKYHDVSKEKILNSRTDSLFRVFKYIGDLNYTDLINRNMLSLPVQQESWVNGKVRNGSILTYNDFGAISARFNFASKSTVDPVTYNANTIIPAYYEKKESLSYDAIKKNIQEVRLENASNILYLWSYSGQYPIAEIKNADYTEVQAVLGASAITEFASKVPTAVEVNAFLAPLRTDIRLKSAVITTYTYDLLVGMTAMTDNRGATSYFEYDGFGRLKLIKDKDGKILKQYDYQYQKPITQ